MYPLTITGFSPDCLNILFILSLVAFLDIIFSLGNARCISSNFPSNDAESVLSVFIFPPITLALVWIALSSPICPHTITTICALASVVLPFAVACILYIPGEINVWVIGVPLSCVPSPKSHIISLTLPLVIALNFVVNGALHDSLSILI
jgi:hypothetical protein